jgi:hypothetical protein
MTAQKPLLTSCTSIKALIPAAVLFRGGNTSDTCTTRSTVVLRAVYQVLAGLALEVLDWDFSEGPVVVVVTGSSWCVLRVERSERDSSVALTGMTSDGA